MSILPTGNPMYRLGTGLGGNINFTEAPDSITLYDENIIGYTNYYGMYLEHRGIIKAGNYWYFATNLYEPDSTLIYKSSDRVTWTDTSFVGDIDGLIKMCTDGSKLYVFCKYNGSNVNFIYGVYNGSSWTTENVSFGVFISDWFIDINSDNEVYVAVSTNGTPDKLGYIYRDKDTGWSSLVYFSGTPASNSISLHSFNLKSDGTPFIIFNYRIVTWTLAAIVGFGGGYTNVVSGTGSYMNGVSGFIENRYYHVYADGSDGIHFITTPDGSSWDGNLIYTTATLGGDPICVDIITIGTTVHIAISAYDSGWTNSNIYYAYGNYDDGFSDLLLMTVMTNTNANVFIYGTASSLFMATDGYLDRYLIYGFYNEAGQTWQRVRRMHRQGWPSVRKTLSSNNPEEWKRVKI